MGGGWAIRTLDSSAFTWIVFYISIKLPFRGLFITNMIWTEGIATQCPQVNIIKNPLVSFLDKKRLNCEETTGYGNIKYYSKRPAKVFNGTYCRKNTKITTEDRNYFQRHFEGTTRTDMENINSTKTKHWIRPLPMTVVEKKKEVW